MTQTSHDVKNIRIAHATDNPKYNAFIETHLPSSKKIKEFNRHYEVIRLKNDKQNNLFIAQLKTWLALNIPFNTYHEKLMNEWDDAMPTISTATKLKLQNIIYLDTAVKNILISKDGFMCSKVIIAALHRSFIQEQLPVSLQLDTILCPSSTTMLALKKDKSNFDFMGILIIPEFEFSELEKTTFEQEQSTNMAEGKRKWQKYLELHYVGKAG